MLVNASTWGAGMIGGRRVMGIITGADANVTIHSAINIIIINAAGRYSGMDYLLLRGRLLKDRTSDIGPHECRFCGVCLLFWSGDQNQLAS